MKGYLVYLLFLSSLARATAADTGLQSDAGEAVAACDVEAFSGDSDPDGLNVRSGPGIGFPIVGVLSPPLQLGSGAGLTYVRYATAFDVLESRDGWFRISGVHEPVKNADGDQDWQASPIEGWVSGTKLDTTFQTELAFAHPDPGSAVVFRNQDMESGGPPDRFAFVECRGEWTRIAYGDRSAPSYAWLRGSCSAQETTCDRAEGDYPHDRP